MIIVVISRRNSKSHFRYVCGRFWDVSLQLSFDTMLLGHKVLVFIHGYKSS